MSCSVKDKMFELEQEEEQNQDLFSRIINSMDKGKEFALEYFDEFHDVSIKLPPKAQPPDYKCTYHRKVEDVIDGYYLTGTVIYNGQNMTQKIKETDENIIGLQNRVQELERTVRELLTEVTRLREIAGDKITVSI